MHLASPSSCTIAVMGPSGRRLREQRVETHGDALRDTIRAIRGRKRVCLEEGELSEWLYEVLEPRVDEMVVVQPARSSGNKSDALDAWTRADELRRGVVDRLVYKSPRMRVELRQAVRAYQTTRRDMVRAKLRLRSRCRSRGVAIVVKRRVRRETVQEAFGQLPPPQRRLAELMLAQVEAMQHVHDEAAEWLHEQGRRVPVVRRLATAPGLGPIRAACVTAAVITPWRFRTKRQFWAYCGLAVVTRSSSDWVRERGKWVRKNVPQTRRRTTTRPSTANQRRRRERKLDAAATERAELGGDTVSAGSIHRLLGHPKRRTGPC